MSPHLTDYRTTTGSEIKPICKALCVLLRRMKHFKVVRNDLISLFFYIRREA